MKVSKKEDFHKFDIGITIESQEDAERLYAIFNTTRITDFLKLSWDEANEARLTIGKKYSNNEVWSELQRSFT